MYNHHIKEKILKLLSENTSINNVFTLKEVYDYLPDTKKTTIRVIIKKLVDEASIIRPKNGIYYVPDPNRVLKAPSVNIENIVDKKYIIGKNDDIIGYHSGINFANELGLTDQTASINTIYSNAVSNKKRIITINKHKIIINSPRYNVDSENYKLLQVLDLLNNFNAFSEISLSAANEMFKIYLKGVILDCGELESIVSSYPLKTQVTFYKLGVQHEITQK